MKTERGKCRNREGKRQEFEAVPWEWGVCRRTKKKQLEKL